MHAQTHAQITIIIVEWMDRQTGADRKWPRDRDRYTDTSGR